MTDKKRVALISVIALLVYAASLIGVKFGSSTTEGEAVTDVIPEITVTSPYSGDITVTSDGLKSISLMFATYARSNTSTVYISLDDEGGNNIASWEISASELSDNVYYKLSIPEAISDSAGKTYTINITSDAESGNGVTVYLSGDKLHFTAEFEGAALSNFLSNLTAEDVLILIVALVPFFLVPALLWKFRDNRYLTVYTVYVLAVIIIHMYIPTNLDDDAFFPTANDGYTGWSWAVWKWNTWSSRFLQEFVGFYVVDRPLLWKFINSSMAALLPYLVNRSLASEDAGRFLAFAVLPIYPVLDMRSAGWMCTTMTYFWPVFTAFLCTAVLRTFMDGKKLKWYDYVMFFTGLIYASNHELMALYLLCIIGYCAFVNFKKFRRIDPFIMSGVAVAVINLVILLICPGTKVRSGAENYRIANYETFNVFDKLFLGINRCVEVFMSNIDSVFTVLCVVIVIAVFRKTKSQIARLIALYPCVLLFAVHFIVGQSLTIEFMTVDISVARIGYVLILAFSMLISLVWSLLVIYREDKIFSFHGMFLALVLTAGLLTTVAMGFSPTIYVSGARTSAFTYFGMIFVILDVTGREISLKNLPEKDIILPATLCSAAFLIADFMAITGIWFV